MKYLIFIYISGYSNQPGVGAQGSKGNNQSLGVPARGSKSDLRKSLQLRLSNSSFLGNSRNNNTEDVCLYLFLPINKVKTSLYSQ
jgi:hypothetical protein